MSKEASNMKYWSEHTSQGTIEHSGVLPWASKKTEPSSNVSFTSVFTSTELKDDYGAKITPSKIEVSVGDFHIFRGHEIEFKECPACRVIDKWETFKHLQKTTNMPVNSKNDILEALIIDDPVGNNPPDNMKPGYKVEPIVGNAVSGLSSSLWKDTIVNPVSEKAENIIIPQIEEIVAQDLTEGTKLI